MKRAITIVLALCIVAMLVPMPTSAAVFAKGQCGQKAFWELDENGTLTVYGSGQVNTESWRLTWKQYTEKITSIVVKSGITEIAGNTFAELYDAKSVTLPQTLKSIGASAFYRCVSLTEIVLPSKLESLGGGAFADTGLQTITIPETITTVSSDLFYDCDRLTSVTFKGVIKDIGEQAFFGCNLLESINFEKGFSGKIGGDAFAYCENLKEIEIPEGVTYIYGSAFTGCKNLTVISLPESLISLGSRSFEGTSLVSVTIPKNVTHIGDDPFNACYQLKDITVYAKAMDGLRGWLAGEEALEYIHIIGDAPLSEEGKIQSRNEDFVIYYDEGTSGWVSPSWKDCLIRLWGKPDAPITGTCGKNLTWSLKDGTLTISGTGPMEHRDHILSAASWNYASKLISQVVIEEGIESIGNDAFYALPNLTSVSIPGSVKSIGSYAFFKCTQLKEINIPEGVESIDVSAFEGCTALTKVTMADSVTNIRWSAFKGCNRLTSIRLSDNLETLSPNLFGDCTNLSSVNIPVKCKKISDIIFTNCSALTGISIPDGVTTIGTYAFKNSGLTEVTIPASVTELMACVFSGCESLQTVYFLGDAPAIGDCAFQDVTATCIYPAGNDTWTETVKQNYDGNIIWIRDDHTHTFEPASAEPTCTEQGYHGQRCSLCGYIIADEYTNALGHDMAEATCTQPSTCRRENCGYQEGRVADHSFGAPCSITRTCSVCGYTDNYGGERSHTWEDPCQTTRTCSACGYSDNEGGHLWDVSDGGIRFCFNCGTFEGGYRLDLPETSDTMWIDTPEYRTKNDDGSRFAVIKGTDAKVLICYTYNLPPMYSSQSRYPTGMKVWRLTFEEDRYTATPVAELENILQYAGSSIRITGTKGIRMITAIDKSKKDALTGKGLAGYKLIEYGTALCWAKDLKGGKPMVLGQDYVKSNYAYKKGVADPIFAKTEDTIQYTNVLVGFTLDQCKNDIAMRSYMILEDKDGTQITIYGGIVYRSIGYIAYQNRSVFKPGTSSYEYVWEIIRKVYGSKYDAEYMG